MKKGDKFPVTIAGHVVAQADVKEVGDGQVTLIVPATLVTMSTRTELAPETPEEKVESGSDHQILGVERDGVSVDPEPVAPVAAVEETTEVTNSEQVVNTPTVETNDNQED